MLQAAAFLVTLAVSVALWAAPHYEGFSIMVPPGRVPENANGLSVRLLAYPVVLSVVPLFLPKLTIHAAIGMALFSLLGSMSIGLFYIPSAALLFLSARPRAAGSGAAHGSNGSADTTSPT
jgi:hypothetical protein